MSSLTDEQLSPECEDLDLSHGPTRLLAAALYWRRRAVSMRVARDELTADAARLDWLLHHLSGKEMRRLGIVTSGGGPLWGRVAIDAVLSQEPPHG